VAQRRVDKRFLARPAKTASARILLALAVAALVLAGCGGGSSDTSSSEASSSDTLRSGTSNTPASGDATGEPGAGAPSAKDLTGGGSAAEDERPSPGDKHGSTVPQPKGAPEPGITPQQRQEATVASMILQSPSSQPSSSGPQVLPARYTCDGESTSPALRWQGVPQGTAELALLVMNIQPVGGELFFDWAVAGLSPDLEEIEAGKLPKGAVVGRNGFGKTGYEICPEGGGETYMFALFALPKKLSPTRGFEPLALRKAALDASGNVGLLALSYAR
jgi:phosphatidylethanolamine-binding protein (PEBP) family uncharacterized protein